eukprot:6202377-Pleurochrysis_carterae.AAC.5
MAEMGTLAVVEIREAAQCSHRSARGAHTACGPRGSEGEPKKSRERAMRELCACGALTRRYGVRTIFVGRASACVQQVHVRAQKQGKARAARVISGSLASVRRIFLIRMCFGTGEEKFMLGARDCTRSTAVVGDRGRKGTGQSAPRAVSASQI